MKNPFGRKVRLQRALKSIYETPEGKVFFEELLRHCGVTHPKFSKDPMETAWNEGRRHLAMSYMSLLGMNDPDSLKERLEELNKQQGEEDE